MASASYEAVAATRPRIRRDVLFTETPDGVLFHNADGGFRLTARSAYRFATLIVPHLDGENSVADLCQGLGDAQRSMVGELVKTLYERDFARDVPPGGERRGHDAPGLAASPDAARRFAPQIAYVDHYADDAEERFRRFRDTRVAVLGDDLVARWCVLSLVRNGCATVGVASWLDTSEIGAEAREAAADGCPVDIRPLAWEGPEQAPRWADLDGYDVVVVTGGADAPGRLLPLLRAGVPEGRSLLPAWTFGGDCVVGPLMAHGTAGCWACAALRLGNHGPSGAAADLWSGLVVPGASAAVDVPGRPLSAMIGNLLGYEVFRVATGALPAETAKQVIVQDMESLDVTAEPLLPHPRCAYCAAPEEGGAAAVDLVSAGSEAALPMPTVATARDADDLVEELNRRSVLVRPRAGVFTRYADEELTQIPLKMSAVELGIGHSGPRSVAAYDIHHVAGARLRALDAAATVYAEHVARDRDVLTGERLASEAAAVASVAPERLTTASGLPAPGEGARLPRVRATSLVTKEPVLVPAAAVRPFGPHNTDRVFDRSGAGAGAGPSPADAAARGLLSALAHDALLRTVRGAAASVVPLPEATAGDTGHDAPEGDAELTFLVRSADRLGVALDLLDLGESPRTGVHVLLARGEGRWAVGSDLDRRSAAVAAVRDLLGAVQYGRDDAGGPAAPGEPLLRDLDARALPVAGSAAAVTGGEPSGWSEVLDRLRSAGRDALLVPTGAADLAAAGIHTVRVLLTTEAVRGA